jgi:hypothetical protein
VIRRQDIKIISPLLLCPEFEKESVITERKKLNWRAFMLFSPNGLVIFLL